MPPVLTFNQLVAPLVILTLVGLAFLAFLINNRNQVRKRQQDARLAALRPPGKNRNHRSLPWRQYFLTQQMTKPSEEDELRLKQWRTLQKPAA